MEVEKNEYQVGLYDEKQKLLTHLKVEAEDELSALYEADLWMVCHSGLEVAGSGMSLISEDYVRDLFIMQGEDCLNYFLKVEGKIEETVKESSLIIV